ncbi:MAG: ribulose-phosphate 3-epimerase [Leptospiraceae bacterium]|nr:ribulose-phosphate 3-epimerase [Leptospiraceae bacterium]MCK6379819.1 ribulose-phosphate 3-epimerase [Leptospiraceae bacterium]NUM41389.1 ribulose-phosphate 3-epimerase [Leptospiraceae bacterium]
MKISPSILASKITGLREILPSLDPKLIDFIHLDVMDGNFVPQISFGEAICKEVSDLTNIPLDIHLMVKNPEFHVPKYFDLNPEIITFHIETTHFGVRLASEIRSKNIKAGISINPGTPVELLEPFLPYIDLILIMTVEPGFYGQSFIQNGYEKIQKAKKIIGNYPIQLEVDGGINPKNIQKISSLGAEIAVAGSAVFNGKNSNENVKELKNLTIENQKKS